MKNSTFITSASSPLTYAQFALAALNNSDKYVDLYMELRRDFFHKWQNEIFPTSITTNFFENIVHWLTVEELPKADGLYEKNFRSWIERNKSKNTA